MTLKIENACDIEDFIFEVSKKTGKDYDIVESALFKLNLYPEGTKSYFSFNDDGTVINNVKEGYEWLDNAFVEIFKECNITQLSLTESI